MPDMSRWDLDERGVPTYVVAQGFSIVTVPDAEGGIVLLEYATSQENAEAGIFEKVQAYMYKDQAEALGSDLLTLASLPQRRAIQ